MFLAQFYKGFIMFEKEKCDVFLRVLNDVTYKEIAADYNCAVSRICDIFWQVFSQLISPVYYTDEMDQSFKTSNTVSCVRKSRDFWIELLKKYANDVEVQFNNKYINKRARSSKAGYRAVSFIQVDKKEYIKIIHSCEIKATLEEAEKDIEQQIKRYGRKLLTNEIFHEIQEVSIANKKQY